MYKVFSGLDASIVEINPLVVTGRRGHRPRRQDELRRQRLYRLKEVEEMHDESERPGRDRGQQARAQTTSARWQYRLHGHGAGLAMATMDIIKLMAASPRTSSMSAAGATKERVTTAFKAHPLRPACRRHPRQHLRRHHALRRHREGVVAAAREVSLPCAAGGTSRRYQRQSWQEDPRRIRSSILSADNLADAAEKIVKAVKEAA